MYASTWIFESLYELISFIIMLILIIVFLILSRRINLIKRGIYPSTYYKLLETYNKALIWENIGDDKKALYYYYLILYNWNDDLLHKNNIHRDVILQKITKLGGDPKIIVKDKL